jgi:intracellular sulfur oxidation DsrE/DsrF family protein
MKKVYWIWLLLSVSLYADVRFAQPLPTIDKPREVVHGVSSGDDETIQHVLSTANNVLKFYGPEKVHMRIVAYYHGIRTVLKNEKAFAPRVDALQQYGVEFVACGNTMRTKNISESELMPDVEVVSAGIAEIIERSAEGAVYIHP